MKLFLATSNKGKIQEMREALEHLDIEFFDGDHFPSIEAPEEHGSTFEENALIKARHYFEKYKHPTIADDSGIIVDALKDELGIHTRRWGAGPHASDEEWIAYFLKRMEREENRKATFVCCIAYIDESGEHLFEGICEGEITKTLEADYLPGLPISACFKPLGFDQVYSAMSIEQKNSTSHRGRAMQKLANHLMKSPDRKQ